MLVTESLNKRREQIFRLVGMGRRGWCRTYRYSLRAHLKQKKSDSFFRELSDSYVGKDGFEPPKA